jgi:hypothetical protein
MDTDPTPPAPAPNVRVAAPPGKASGWAVTSLIVGVGSALGGGLLVIPSLLAIGCGHVARARIRRDPRLVGGRLALGGCVLGYLSLLYAVAGILAYFGVPPLDRVQASAYQQVLLNDGQRLGLAAEQYMLENGVDHVVVDVDPETGEVKGPLSDYLTRVTRGTRAVDGQIELNGTFSLQHPRAFGGAEQVFGTDGQVR